MPEEWAEELVRLGGRSFHGKQVFRWIQARGVTDPAAMSDLPAPIRTKLADPILRKGANPDDLAALETFYKARAGGPLWMTDMGLSAKGFRALSEIAQADDWGLAASAFDLPSEDELPANPEAEALTEVKLDLAILKYARFARGGRLNPLDLDDKLDQIPPVRDPNAVLAEITASDAPDSYLRSLHPKHEQFARLRQALLKMRGKDEDGAQGEPRHGRIGHKGDAREDPRPGAPLGCGVVRQEAEEQRRQELRSVGDAENP